MMIINETRYRTEDLEAFVEAFHSSSRSSGLVILLFSHFNPYPEEPGGDVDPHDYGLIREMRPKTINGMYITQRIGLVKPTRTLKCFDFAAELGLISPEEYMSLTNDAPQVMKRQLCSFMATRSMMPRALPVPMPLRFETKKASKEDIKWQVERAANALELLRLKDLIHHHRSDINKKRQELSLVEKELYEKTNELEELYERQERARQRRDLLAWKKP